MYSKNLFICLDSNETEEDEITVVRITIENLFESHILIPTQNVCYSNSVNLPTKSFMLISLLLEYNA